VISWSDMFSKIPVENLKPLICLSRVVEIATRVQVLRVTGTRMRSGMMMS